MSMTPRNFKNRIATLISRGYSAQRADELANAIGDIIETDSDGKWVVRDSDENIIEKVEPC